MIPHISPWAQAPGSALNKAIIFMLILISAHTFCASSQFLFVFPFLLLLKDGKKDLLFCRLHIRFIYAGLTRLQHSHPVR